MLTAAVFAFPAALPVQAQPLANPVATFAGLDKITGRITRFDVYIDETVLFGALEITPRACYNRPASDTLQRTSAFLEVNQMSLDGTGERIFTGWMFADSPALNAVDHAVYDVWLIECKTSTNVPPPAER
ncbi:glycosyl hydrolase family 5 [Devosia elaeis]|uniref:Glycosyl hydrolase family 5 n=1 Tax=Devosia elaeis TaxID=1770058 RepID=A0A178HTL4_9HYPH|nr:glycosyl hydrolase family 5 [Devosia elaeis]